MTQLPVFPSGGPQQRQEGQCGGGNGKTLGINFSGFFPHIISCNNHRPPTSQCLPTTLRCKSFMISTLPRKKQGDAKLSKWLRSQTDRPELMLTLAQSSGLVTIACFCNFLQDLQKGPGVHRYVLLKLLNTHCTKRTTRKLNSGISNIAFCAVSLLGLLPTPGTNLFTSCEGQISTGSYLSTPLQNGLQPKLTSRSLYSYDDYGNISQNCPNTGIIIYYFITTMKTNTLETLLTAKYIFLI